MKLPPDEFQKICEKISKNSFKYMKRKIQNELDSLKKHYPHIDSNVIISIIINSLGILDGNIIHICKTIHKGIHQDDINIEKLLETHQRIINETIETYSCEQKLN